MLPPQGFLVLYLYQQIMSYLQKIENYMPSVQGEYSHFWGLDKALKDCRSQQLQYKIWTIQTWLKTQQAQTYQKQQKAKQIAQRIRIFDGFMSGDEMGYNLCATGQQVATKTSNLCSQLMELQIYYNSLVFGELSKELGRNYQLKIRLDTEARAAYNKIQTLRKLNTGNNTIMVSSAMLVSAANTITEKSTFNDFKSLILQLHIENQFINEDYKQAITIQDLARCYFQTNLKIKPKINSGSFNIEILEKSIDNPNYVLRKEAQKGKEYIQKARAVLKQVKKPLQTINKDNRESQVVLMYNLQKFFKQINSSQPGKKVNSSLFDQNQNLNQWTTFQTDDYVRNLLLKIDPRQQDLETQIREYTREFQIYTFRQCRTPNDLNNSFQRNIVGTNSQWGIFTKTSDAQYFISNTYEFRQLSVYQDRIKTASKIFYFMEKIDENLIRLNKILEDTEDRLRKENKEEARKLAKKMLFKIKLQLCFRAFQINYQEAVKNIAGKSVRLKTERIKLSELFR